MHGDTEVFQSLVHGDTEVFQSGCMATPRCFSLGAWRAKGVS